MELFSENLKATLFRLGMTQQELSDATGIANANISRIINGKEKVTIDRAERIASAVGKELSELLKKPKVTA